MKANLIKIHIHVPAWIGTLCHAMPQPRDLRVTWLSASTMYSLWSFLVQMKQ